ncbi:hypothetical protein Tco_1217321 [Tanacetum coccineum]
MSRKKVLTLDKDSESVDSTKYRGMISSLLYLTASWPDIMFSVCLCARFQEDPKVSHLEAVKGIFRKMSNSEESVNKGEIGESSKKLKRKFKTMKGYIRDERPRTPRRLCSWPMDPRLGTRGSNDLGGARVKISILYFYTDIILLNVRPRSRLFDLTKGDKESKEQEAYGLRKRLA